MMIRSRNTLTIGRIIRSYHKQSNSVPLILTNTRCEKLHSILRSRCCTKYPWSITPKSCFGNRTSTRSYASFNHSKAPTEQFLGSILDHEYTKAKFLLFDEDKRAEYLADLGDMSIEKVPVVTEDFYKVVEASFEFHDEGFRFITPFWKALTTSTDEILLDLQKTILKRRERLLMLILNSGRFDIYESLILPSIKKLVPDDDLGFLDRVTTILELQSTSSGAFYFNEKQTMSLLMNDTMSKNEKRDLVKILVTNSFAAGKSSSSRMYSIETFLKCAKLIEGDDWFASKESFEYDSLFQMIGFPTIEDRFDDYFQEIIKIVEKHYDPSISYDFLTEIMRNLSERAPFVTYRLFEFKSAQWRQRNLPRKDVLNHLDLAYAMKACMKLDENKIYEIYLQNEDLHDDESQEAIFLDLCVEHKDWKSLQDRFENMYGKGNLPDTVHYGITMQALEFLEADSELERLYEQILDRGLMMNSAIFIARMKARIRQRNQTDVIALLEEYLSLAAQERAYKDGISLVFPFAFQLLFLEGTNKDVLQTVQIYLEKEQKLQLPIVSGEALCSIANYFSQNCASKDLDELFKLAKEYQKCDSGFTCNLIDAYSNLGQYSKADEIAYFAHAQSHPPFSDLRIYASQLKNHLRWRRQDISRSIKRYNDIKVNYIMSLSLQSDFTIFQSRPGGIDLLSLVMDSLRYNAVDYSRANALRYLKGRAIKTISSLIRRQTAYRIRLDEKLYLPLMKQNLIYENYKPLNVMKIFNEMNQRGVLVSAQSYKHVMKAMRSLDKRYDRSYNNSTEMLNQMLSLYGFEAEKSKSNPKLDFRKDSLIICEILIKYVQSVGLKKGSDLFSKFVLFCEESFEGKLPLDLRVKIDLFLSECYKDVNSVEYGAFLEQKFEVYSNILSEHHNSNDVCVPMVLNDALSYFTIQRMKYLVDVNSFTYESQGEILDVISMGVQPNIFDFNYLIAYFLKEMSSVHLTKVMEIIERRLIIGNLAELESYKEKKLCYKICMNYLCEVYNEQTVADNYKILSDYFGIKSLTKVRAQSENLKQLDFLKSASGRLFNIKSDPYGSRSMNQFSFIEYFNPVRDFTNEPRLFNETSRLLMRAISEYKRKNKKDATSLLSLYPKVSKFCKSNLSYYSHLNAFNRKVDYLNSSQDTRLRRTKDVLKELLFIHNSTKIFIPKPDDLETNEQSL
ncbi:hypothetical protein I9W82_000036 [Candida metapsilosis]|uniref:Mitochondrial group I intron splicing factor CCM1 n=1 Tax=Candida metapsilosis TaxID=273372 RepID=A0A8H7ZKP8_9ASCO|nr:hypothetical protein I9W82_000036 [Candida metapsilosis]